MPFMKLTGTRHLELIIRIQELFPWERERERVGKYTHHQLHRQLRFIKEYCPFIQTMRSMVDITQVEVFTITPINVVRTSKEVTPTKASINRIYYYRITLEENPNQSINLCIEDSITNAPYGRHEKWVYCAKHSTSYPVKPHSINKEL